MKTGVFIERPSIDAFVASVAAAAEQGIQSVWTPQIFGLDAITALTVAAREVPDISVGTAVVPVQPRHPVALAIQALSAAEATGGRLTLGVGLSHQMVVEGMWGLPFDKPAGYMREYLSVLGPLLAREPVSFAGDVFRVNQQIDVPDAPTVPLLVAALGPRMLEIAATLSDGTITWMTGPETIGSHIVPTMRSAAEAAGRPDPHVVCCLPLCVTDDADAAREKAAKVFAHYGYLPSYRAMLDREGAAGPADVAVVGDEAAVAEAVGDLFDRGVTEFVGVPFDRDHHDRTLSLLTSLG